MVDSDWHLLLLPRQLLTLLLLAHHDAEGVSPGHIMRLELILLGWLLLCRLLLARVKAIQLREIVVLWEGLR